MRSAFLLLLTLVALPAYAGEVQIGALSCRTNADETVSTCSLRLEGKVESNHVLTFRALPTDVVSFNGAELGRSGYNGARRFNASVLPRAYSLARLQGEQDPTLELVIRTVSTGDRGIYSPDSTLFQVIRTTEVLELYLRHFGTPILQLSLIVLLLTMALVPLSQRRDGWQWPTRTLAIFYVAAAGYCTAMTQLPKVAITYFVSSLTYDVLHAANQLPALWALVELARGCRFRDPFAWPREKAQNSVDRVLTRLNLAVLLLGWAWLAVTWLRQDVIYPPHCTLVLAFALLGFAELARAAAELRWHSALKRSSRWSLFFAGAVGICALVQLRDAIFYVEHAFGRFYYNRYVYLVVIAFGAFRSFDLSRIERFALSCAATLREGLRSLSGGEDRLALIAARFQTLTRAERVSILSIRGNSALILASAGPTARSIDRDPKALGRWMRKVLKRGCASRFPVYFPTDGGLRSADLYTVPIRQGTEWVSAITVMREKGEFSPAILACADALAAEVSGEVTSALAHTVVEQQVRELEALAVSTSGILFEQRDSWGRLREMSAQGRRVIVSADGVRTTHLSEVSEGSPRIREVSIAYKRALYAEWMAIRTALELVSKDVRGDDFWALSPREFRDPLLRELGPERVCLIAAALIEQRCREISLLPEYRVLGRPGAHVAVAAGDVLFLSLGTRRAKCIDVDAPVMARLHRIRSSARPGEVLVDVDDRSLLEALGDNGLFEAGDAADPETSNAYPGLHRLPRIARLTGLKEHPAAIAIAERILNELRSTRDSA